MYGGVFRRSTPRPANSVHRRPRRLRQTTKRVSQLFNWDGAELSSAEKARLEELLEEFEHVVAKDSSDLGRTSKVYHRIPTGDAAPIKQAPRRVPFHQREELERNLREMLHNGIIKPSTSPWASPVVLVRKKDGGTGVCADYRRLNDVTRKDAYPIPRVDSTFDGLGGAKFFSTIDLASGYWQVEVRTEKRQPLSSLKVCLSTVS